MPKNVDKYHLEGKIVKEYPKIVDLLVSKGVIPLMNDCKTYEDLRKLNGKVVRYIGFSTDI